MATRGVVTHHFAGPGNLESLRHGFTGLAARYWLRHKARKIGAVLRGNNWFPMPSGRATKLWLNGVKSRSFGPMDTQGKRPQVVIIGAGFGGLEAAKLLGDEPVRVTVIDRTNYHLFQPLLYQVATAALSPADIAAPIRGVLTKYPEHRGDARGSERGRCEAKKVITGESRDSLRLSDPRDRLSPFLFRARRMGKTRAGSEESGRRDRDSAAISDGVRICRERSRTRQRGRRR